MTRKIFKNVKIKIKIIFFLEVKMVQFYKQTVAYMSTKINEAGYLLWAIKNVFIKSITLRIQGKLNEFNDRKCGKLNI